MCGEQSVALSEGQSAGLCADQSAALTCRPISSQPASLKLQGVPSVAVEALLDVFVCLEKTNYSTKEYTLPYILSYVQIKHRENRKTLPFVILFGCQYVGR